jgi:hypothetical protein
LIALVLESAVMSDDSVRHDFQEYLASRRPIPEGHGVLLDTRAMPVPAGVADVAPHLSFFAGKDGPTAMWRFASPLGELEIELALRGSEPPPLPDPNRTSRTRMHSHGPAGLGEFAVEDGDSFGLHEIGWLRGNVTAAVRRSFGGLRAPSRTELDQNRRAAGEVAAAMDRWLATLPIVDLRPQRLALEPIITPADPVEGEQVSVTWKSPPERERFELRVDDLSDHLRPQSLEPDILTFRAERAGAATVTVTLIDRRTLVTSRRSVGLTVRTFDELSAGLGAGQLVRMLSRARPELSWRIVARLLPEPGPFAETLAPTYPWWSGDALRAQELVTALWPVAEARRALLREPALQADLPRWIDFFAAKATLSPDSIDVDGLERHRQVARAIVSELMAAQRGDVVRHLALSLRPAITIGIWKSLAEAFHAVRDTQGAIAALALGNQGIASDDPLTVLWHSNVAAEQVFAGNDAQAQQTLDAILARDWRLSATSRTQSLASLQAQARAGKSAAGRAYLLRLYLALAHYNRACARARLGDVSGTVADLVEARRANPDCCPPGKLAADHDFDRVRDAPAFIELTR